MMRHRESWAVENTAPSAEQAARAQADATVTTRATARRPPGRVAVSPPATASANEELPRDILIVASKLKKYVRAKSGMRTSDTCLDALSTIVRDACNEAIRRAGADGRQTIMDRDFRRY